MTKFIILCFSFSMICMGALVAQDEAQVTSTCPCKDCKCSLQADCGCMSGKGCACTTSGACCAGKTCRPVENR